MASFGDILQEAVKDLYNNPATANSTFTPAFAARSVNRALKTYWRKFMSNEWGYYRFSEKVLAVTSSTDVYALPNGNPGNDDTDNVAIVTASGLLLSGSGATARFAPLGNGFPTDKYKGSPAYGNMYAYLTNQGGGGGLPVWSLEKGAPDADGYPTYYIRFRPWFTSSQSVYYDGVRYPYPITIDEDGSVDEAQILDCPDHLSDCIKLRVLKDCHTRGKIDVSEVLRDLAELEVDAFKVEERNAERQGSNVIKRTERQWGDYAWGPGYGG